MMLGLMLNVIPDDWHVRRTHAECSVTLLPRERNPMLTYPTGGVRFQDLHSFRDGYVRRQCDQEMDMIGRSACAEDGDVVIPPNTGQIFP